MLLVACLLLIPLPSPAGELLTFTMGPGGTVAYGNGNGNAGQLSGSKIDITQIALGSSTTPISDGRMFFNFGSSDSLQNSDRGDELVVTGCAGTGLCGKQKADEKDLVRTLITASILDYHIVEKHGETFLVADVVEHVDPRLAAYLKLSKTTFTAQLDLELLQVKCEPRRQKDDQGPRDKDDRGLREKNDHGPGDKDDQGTRGKDGRGVFAEKERREGDNNGKHVRDDHDNPVSEQHGCHIRDDVEGGTLTTLASSSVNTPEPPSSILLALPLLWLAAWRWWRG